MTKKENENVIKQIKIAMAEMGLNQTSLAKKVGVKPNTVSQWLTGTNSPKMDTLKKVAKATGKPVNYFFDNSTDVKGNQNIVGKNITVSPDVEKDIALMRVKIEALESKIENLELKYNLLKKGK
ncbi:MAG: helix-turn-helix domain-containing protein [Elusimicrobia bacterium]|nr:helix-turn-helix domain-containing protein [Elusimicrobiota bacterium]MDD7502461.1 helix-turn-helix transcriptional regulator [Elusimicrobiota bacterium]MDY5729585.1 helix-turn-helix transcriptional regulator [Elusimicrobiaceae bacterium]